MSIFIASQKDLELSNDKIKDLSCETFPSKYFKKCTEIVDYYSVSIKNLVKDDLNENDICTKIGKCTDNEGKHAFRVVMDAHKTKRTVVGENECTWGPDHWCSSKEVAEKCAVNVKIFINMVFSLFVFFQLTKYCEEVWKAKEV